MIKDYIEKLIEQYSDNPISRSAVIALAYFSQLAPGLIAGANNSDSAVATTSVAIAATVFDLISSHYGQKIISEERFGRIETLLDELHETTRHLSIQMIDQDYLRSEQWLDLILKAIDSANKTRDEDKIRIYARILKGAVLSKSDRDKTSAEEYLYMLSDLTPKEIEMSYYLFNEIETNNNGLWYQSICEKCDIDSEDLQFYLNRIESVGLIANDNYGRVAPDPGIGGMVVGAEGSSSNLHLYYSITGGFRKLMEFIKD
jgi:hypothetical protein